MEMKFRLQTLRVAATDLHLTAQLRLQAAMIVYQLMLVDICSERNVTNVPTPLIPAVFPGVGWEFPCTHTRPKSRMCVMYAISGLCIHAAYEFTCVYIPAISGSRARSVNAGFWKVVISRDTCKLTRVKSRLNVTFVRAGLRRQVV